MTPTLTLAIERTITEEATKDDVKTDESGGTLMAQENNVYDKVDENDDDAHDPSFPVLACSLYFCYYASLGCVVPYMTLFYRSVGHRSAMVGLLSSISPLITIFVTPMWGILSDKMENRTSLLFPAVGITLLTRIAVPFGSSFAYLGFLAVVTSIFASPIKPLIDSMVMANLSDRSRFGSLRVWGLIGFGISNYVGGSFLNLEKKSNPNRGSFWGSRENGFLNLFCMNAALHIPVVLCLVRLKYSKGSATKKRQGSPKAKSMGGTSMLGNTVDALVKEGDAVLFFLILLSLGISSSISDNNTFVRIQEVGGTGHDIGLCRFYSTLAGIPMFFLSGKLSRRMGVGAVLCLSFLGYFIRFTIHANLRRPYQAYFADVCRGLSFGLFWSSANLHASNLMPVSMNATMLMLLNTSYNGVGRVLGSIASGYMQDSFGTAKTFYYASLFNLSVGLCLSWYLLSHPHSSLCSKAIDTTSTKKNI